MKKKFMFYTTRPVLIFLIINRQMFQAVKPTALAFNMRGIDNLIRRIISSVSPFFIGHEVELGQNIETTTLPLSSLLCKIEWKNKR